jgi:hypothetical protein
MEEELTINYLNNNEKILKYNCESNKRYAQRILFIRILEKEKIKWKDAYKLSKIWYNIKFNKCKYLPKIYKQYVLYDSKLSKQENL